MRMLGPLCEAEEGTAADGDSISPDAESAVDGGCGITGLGGEAGLTSINAGVGRVSDEVFQDIEHMLLDLDEHDGSTLVGGDEAGVMQGVKTMDMDITDDEDASASASASANQTGGGVKRKRTIRLIIRSRAFL